MERAKNIVRVDAFFDGIIFEFIDSYLEKAKINLENLNETEIKLLEKFAHSLSGTSGTYSLCELSEMASDLESLAKRNELNQYKEKLKDIIQYLETLEITFKKG